MAQSSPSPAKVIPHFQDIARESGLGVPHTSSVDKRYIMESTSGGVGFIDCDNDGNLDIITVNGSTVESYKKGGDPMITLYHQDKHLKFSDITKSAGLTRNGWGMGVSVMDYDNDGWQDIFVTGYGGDILYRNLGNCKFEDVTVKSGLKVEGWTTGGAWADYDRDGHLDLFISRYLDIDINKLPAFGSDDKFCRYKGVMVQCGPGGLPGESDYLFHNRGDGTFEDVSKKAGVDDADHFYGLTGIWADYDNDGWPDLYVANDSQPNYLYHNNHDGTFEDVGLMSGAALSLEGRPLGSMGIDFADIDHDGRLDIFVTNFSHESNNLYWNQGDRGFTDIAESGGVIKPDSTYVGWGAGFIDIDNDGWPDIFLVNGHVYPQMDDAKGEAGYRQPVILYRNEGNRVFKDVTALAGLHALPLSSRRGVAFGDVNNDGKTDILILNIGEPPTLLLNRTESSSHAVLFHLVGTKSNRAAIGARVTVTAGTFAQMNEVRSGGSYISQNDLRLHFGLGANNVMSAVQIAWPSGTKEDYKNLPADLIYTMVEGKGITDKTSLSAGSK